MVDILSAEGSPKAETRSTETSLLLVRGGVLRAGDRAVSQDQLQVHLVTSV